MPVVGYNGQTVNWLRLFTARSSEDFDIEIFNRGDYIRAVEQKIASRKHLARAVSVRLGRRRQGTSPRPGILPGRLRHSRHRSPLPAAAQRTSTFPGKVAIQMNDTHPSLAVAELMRVLIDEHDLPWEQAWEITQQDAGLHQPHAASRSAGEVVGVR